MHPEGPSAIVYNIITVLFSCFLPRMQTVGDKGRTASKISDMTACTSAR